MACMCASTNEASPKAQAQKSPPRVCQGPCWQRWRLLGLWSDETKINVFRTDGFKTVCRRKGEEYKEKCMVPTVKLVAVSICGAAWVLLVSGSCISLMASWIHKCTALHWKRRCYHHSVPLVVVHFSNMTMILNTSKATVGFLKKNRVKVIQWPSMSPDLNPIKHLWGILKRQVEHHSPSSIQSLKEVILEEWKKIDLAKCRQLVHSIPRRLGAVIKNHGGHTKY